MTSRPDDPPSLHYDGAYYAAIGDFLGERYLDYGFTKGTIQEVDFLVELLGLPDDARILDVGRGPGRHSLEPARRAYRTLGIDISRAFFEIASRQAAEEGLPAEFVVADVRAMTFDREFDAAICLREGAFGLAGNEDGHRQVLAGIHRAPRPGAPFVLTALNAVAAARNAEEVDAFDPYTCTTVVRERAEGAGGETREVEYFTTAFTYRELTWLLADAGFAVEAGYGCVAGHFARKPLDVDDIEIMMVARRA
ncbi:MAG: class I SAM-dependent methyltransferase [Thermomicrobiales bacterium]